MHLKKLIPTSQMMPFVTIVGGFELLTNVTKTSISRVVGAIDLLASKNSAGVHIKLVFFNWDSLHARLNSPYKAWSYKNKKHKKD